MNLIKRLFVVLLVVFLIPSESEARKKAVAILETAIEGKKAKLDPAELAYITEEFRGVALEALGTLQYHIMTKDNIMMMLPPGKSLSECVGECIVETGKNVGADFVTQGVVRKVGKRLSFTSSLYDTKNNQLKGSVRVLAKDIDGLIDGIAKKAPKLFSKLAKKVVVESHIEVGNSVEVKKMKLNAYSRIKDSRDGKIYKTVKIGNQIWMGENLNYGSYLRENSSSSQYQNGAQKFCYDNNTLNCDSQGGLYQWHTAMALSKSCGDGSKSCVSQISNRNHQGICPSGWHIPKQAEWDTLEAYLDEASTAGKKMKFFSFGGDKGSGSLCLGTGFRSPNGTFFQNAFASFWAAVEYNAGYGRSRTLNSCDIDLNRSNDIKHHGFSVRCVRN
jgi:uncharacterized protein (TIGR02145 family)